MKFFIFHLTAICIFVQPASAQLSPAFFLDTLQHQAIHQIICSDFNHDGQEDILTLNLQWPHDHMRLYLQTSQQAFSTQIIPTTDSLSHVEHLAAGDLNQDGWTDIVMCHGFPYQITWFENRTGEFIAHNLNDSLEFTSRVVLEDLNRDGMLDILAIEHIEITVYMALAPGLFDQRRVIHGTTEFYALETGDFNQDDIPDVAVASGGFEILLGDGTGHFTLHDQEGLHLVFGLRQGDLDGDGDVDLAAFDVLQGIYFYANDGFGRFERQHAILSSTDHFLQYSLDDLNCDNRMDLLTAQTQLHTVCWVENLGSGQFSLPHVLHIQDPELIMAVDLADLDGNGRPDPVWGNKQLGAMLNECQVTHDGGPASERNPHLLYPNPVPAGQRITIQYADDIHPCTMILTDMTGRTVTQTTCSSRVAEVIVPDISGIYALTIQSNESSQTHLITVQ